MMYNYNIIEYNRMSFVIQLMNCVHIYGVYPTISYLM